MTNSASSQSSNPRSLANFDYAFNGALDQAQVEEIITADFVGRGENLTLVGGSATGKSAIANAVVKAAENRGLTSEYLWCPSHMMSDYQLIDSGPGFVGSTQANSGLRDGLLNCDVLVVDEFERWLESSPACFLLLIGRRIELGKSNVLVSASYGWARFGTKEVQSRISASLGFNFAGYLLENLVKDGSMFARKLATERSRSLQEMLHLVGIDIKLPNRPAVDDVRPRVAVWDVSPFTKAPVWHSLYTGENSYREVLRRRAA